MKIKLCRRIGIINPLTKRHFEKVLIGPWMLYEKRYGCSDMCVCKRLENGKVKNGPNEDILVYKNRLHFPKQIALQICDSTYDRIIDQMVNKKMPYSIRHDITKRWLHAATCFTGKDDNILHLYTQGRRHMLMKDVCAYRNAMSVHLFLGEVVYYD